jgi:hypothetical protein
MGLGAFSEQNSLTTRPGQSVEHEPHVFLGIDGTHPVKCLLKAYSPSSPWNLLMQKMSKASSSVPRSYPLHDLLHLGFPIKPLAHLRLPHVWRTEDGDFHFIDAFLP